MSSPATDLTGGAIQLMLAFGHADILRTSIVDQDYQEEMATQIQDALVSVIAMLCKKGGIDLYQYGGEYYFFPAKNELCLNLGDGGIGWRILALSKTPIFRRKDTP